MIDVVIKGVLAHCFVEIDQVALAKSTLLLRYLDINIDNTVSSRYLFLHEFVL